MAATDDFDEQMALQDLWVLTYHDGQAGQAYEAIRRVTTREAMRIFLVYLGGDRRWRTRLLWREIPARQRRRRSR